MTALQNIAEDFSTPETEEKHGRDPGELLEQRERIRRSCLSAVERAASSTIIGQADVRAYRDMVFSESSLELVGMTSHQEKLAALRDNLHRMIPKIISDARSLEREFTDLLLKARASGGITQSGVDRWVDRLKDDNVIYMKKKDFVKKRFKKYVENWIELGSGSEDRREEEKGPRTHGRGHAGIEASQRSRFPGFALSLQTRPDQCGARRDRGIRKRRLQK